MKKTRIIALLLSLITLVIPMSGCLEHFPQIIDDTDDDNDDDNPIIKYPIESSDIHLSNEFAFNLFKLTVTKDDKNDLFSPLSALYCIGMIANGADNNTLAELEEALGTDIDTLNSFLKSYVEGLYSNEKCKVKIADSIWIRDCGRFHVNEDFIKLNKNYYKAAVESEPFDKDTVKKINKWVKDNTDGMIKEIIDKLDEDTVMLLANTLLFDAKWEEQYEKSQIDDRFFTNYDNKSDYIKMLCSDERIYLESENAVGFCKNYYGGRYSFVGILPNEGIDLYQFITNFEASTWEEMWETRDYCEVDVIMPKFTYDCETDLTKMLGKIGIKDLFDLYDCDLSKLGYSDAGNLYVSKIKQKTHIEVDENGTKAAAVTWGEVKDTCVAEPTETKTVYLDRPFIYMIVDNRTGMPLFIGSVSNLVK